MLAVYSNRPCLKTTDRNKLDFTSKRMNLVHVIVFLLSVWTCRLVAEICPSCSSQTYNPNRITYGNYSLQSLIRQQTPFSGLVVMTSRRRETGSTVRWRVRLTLIRTGNMENQITREMKIVATNTWKIMVNGAMWNATERALLSASSTSSTTGYSACRPAMMAASFTKNMLHHVMEELPGKSVVSCGEVCRSHPRCHSFNLLEQDEGKMVCQLNNATHREVTDGDMKVNERWYFFDLLKCSSAITINSTSKCSRKKNKLLILFFSYFIFIFFILRTSKTIKQAQAVQGRAKV